MYADEAARDSYTLGALSRVKGLCYDAIVELETILRTDWQNEYDLLRQEKGVVYGSLFPVLIFHSRILPHRL